jgi:hypothetical protein
MMVVHVPINDIHRVQTFECREKLGGVEPRSFFAKSALALKMVEQFSAVDESYKTKHATVSRSSKTGAL